MVQTAKIFQFMKKLKQTMKKSKKKLRTNFINKKKKKSLNQILNK